MQQYHRKSPRKEGYDYTSEGGYFVTICAFQRKELFGDINHDEMFLNTLGLLAEKYWRSIPEHFPQVTVDTFIIMPNHVHGILFFDEPTQSLNVGTTHVSSTIGAKAGSLGRVIGAYKAIVSKAAREIINNPMMQIWQERYHDRIIRNQRECDAIRTYIGQNPINWAKDEFFRTDI